MGFTEGEFRVLKKYVKGRDIDDERDMPILEDWAKVQGVCKENWCES